MDWREREPRTLSTSNLGRTHTQVEDFRHYVDPNDPKRRKFPSLLRSICLLVGYKLPRSSRQRFHTQRGSRAVSRTFSHVPRRCGCVFLSFPSTNKLMHLGKTSCTQFTFDTAHESIEDTSQQGPPSNPMDTMHNDDVGVLQTKRSDEAMRNNNVSR